MNLDNLLREPSINGNENKAKSISSALMTCSLLNPAETCLELSKVREGSIDRCTFATERIELKM